jgi:hypothetical protein
VICAEELEVGDEDMKRLDVTRRRLDKLKRFIGAMSVPVRRRAVFVGKGFDSSVDGFQERRIRVVVERLAVFGNVD